MAKLTRKSYRRKRVVLGAVLLGAVALVSTGFAAWVLSANATEQATGNVKLGIVNDTDMEISIDSGSLNQTISFNAKSDDNSGRIRYSSADGVDAENLTITISGSITNTEYLDRLTIKMDKLAGIDKAIAGNYIALNNEDSWYGAEQTVTVTSGEGSTKIFTYTLGFKWGSAFGGVNPSVYYDDAGKDVSDADMKAQLVAFKKAIGNLSDSVSDAEALADSTVATYTVTLTAYNN